MGLRGKFDFRYCILYFAVVYLSQEETDKNGQPIWLKITASVASRAVIFLCKS